MNIRSMSYGIVSFIFLNVSVYSMQEPRDDEVKKYRVPYVIDANCFRRFVPQKQQHAARKFNTDFILRNTPFEKNFRQFDAYAIQKSISNKLDTQQQETATTLLPSLSSTYAWVAPTLTWVGSWWGTQSPETQNEPRQISLSKAPLFNWEKPCYISAETELKSGFKNYLQDLSDTQKGVKIYEIPSGAIIIKKAPVAKVMWSDDGTCCAVIQKESESSCLYKAFLRDLKNNKEYFVDCAVPGPDGLSHFIECENDLRFVTKMEDMLHITRMRPDGKTFMIARQDFSMLRTYFCDKYIWIHYKEQQKNEDKNKKEGKVFIPSEKLVVYEILKDGFNVVAEVVVDNSIKYIFDPYGTPENKHYISFCRGGMVYVYNAATAEVKYRHKQATGSRLVGMWNTDGTLYAISDAGVKGRITVHDFDAGTAVELKNPDNNDAMIADGGFQDHYVGVSSAASFMVFDSKTGRLAKRIPVESKHVLEYGFCVPNCVYVCTDNQVMIYDFSEYKIKVDVQYTPCIRVSAHGNNYCGYVVSKNFKKIFLVNTMTASVKTFDYTSAYDFWFNASGDRLLIVYGEKNELALDIIETSSGALVMTFGVDTYIHDSAMSSDNSLCALLWCDKKTIVIYDLNDTSKPLKKLEYTNTVTSMKFDDAVSVFVVTTNKETYAYSVHDRGNQLLTN